MRNQSHGTFIRQKLLQERGRSFKVKGQFVSVQFETF